MDAAAEPLPGADPLPPWRPLLRAARQREGRSPMARWLQLATVAADGTPRVRTLVFRGWGGASQLDLLTEGRSAKLAELQAQPAVELCWLLPRARCQFRLRGQLQILPGADHPHHWQALTPGGRALWGWPEPGAPLREAGAFPAELPAETPIPPCFVLLRINLLQVELLELGSHPHRRSRWCAAAGWSEARLNP
ncbi:MAG: pyridoxamine 5'-phosphate oxidase family protein [Vulcanococcus sp.]